MKKTLLLVATIATIATATAQDHKFEVHAKGSGNSTWLFNNNISNTGDQQDYAPGWGFNYGLGFVAYFGKVGVGIEGLMGSHTGAYQGTYRVSFGNTVLSETDYNSSIKLNTVQVPLLFKVRSESGFYFELGPQFNLIQSAKYTRTMDGGSKTSGDASSYYNKNYFSGVMGLGFGIDLGKLPIAILAGLRLQYSFTDLKGVDAVGTDLSNTVAYPKYEKTSAASAGLMLGAIYKFGSN